MNGKFIGIVILTVALVGVAWKVSEDKAAQTDVSRSELYPGMLDRLNEVTRLEVRSSRHTTSLERSADGQRWLVANKDGFPATFSEVKRVILQVAGLVIVEAKTNRADSYARIGVDDVTAAGATGTEVKASAADGKPLFGLVVGNPRSGAAEQRYVRRVGEEQAWLVDGALSLDADPIRWLDARIADIDTARVREVRIEQPGLPPVLIRKDERKDNFFTLQDVPEGFIAKSKATVSAIGAVLLDLRFNDVAAASAVAAATPARTLRITTFDGLVATLDDFELGERKLTRFAFAFDPTQVVTEPPANGADATPPADATVQDPAASSGSAAAPGSAAGTDAAVDAAGEAAEADGPAPAPGASSADAAGETATKESVADEAARLAAATSGWVYVLPDYKRRMMVKKLEDLIQKPDAAKP